MANNRFRRAYESLKLMLEYGETTATEEEIELAKRKAEIEAKKEMNEAKKMARDFDTNYYTSYRNGF